MLGWVPWGWVFSAVGEVEVYDESDEELLVRGTECEDSEEQE